MYKCISTMLIAFLMAGYYLMREVLLLFVLFRRLMVRRYTVISHSMHILQGTKWRKEWDFFCRRSMFLPPSCMLLKKSQSYRLDVFAFDVRKTQPLILGFLWYLVFLRCSCVTCSASFFVLSLHSRLLFELRYIFKRITLARSRSTR